MGVSFSSLGKLQQHFVLGKALPSVDKFSGSEALAGFQKPSDQSDGPSQTAVLVQLTFIRFPENMRLIPTFLLGNPTSQSRSINNFSRRRTFPV